MSFLEFRNFSLGLDVGKRPVLADVSLHVDRGEIVGLVGESGSGKSTTARAALRLTPAQARAAGRIDVQGRDVFSLGAEELRTLRTRTAAMIFQDARSSLNPVRRVGDFLTEQLRTTAGWSKEAARTRAIEMLESVGLAHPERVLRQYPHELSGGMLQRVVIAAALAVEPALVLADEPTSALDVTTQAETLTVLKQLQTERDLALLFITHDLHLAGAFCDRVYVMYAGRVVEEQRGSELLKHPRHPYTTGLLRSAPDLESARRLDAIPGQPPSLDETASGCPFAPRCVHAEPACDHWHPELLAEADAWVACRRVAEWASPEQALPIPTPVQESTDE